MYVGMYFIPPALRQRRITWVTDCFQSQQSYDDVLNDDIDVMMAAPPSLQKSGISTNTAFSPLLLRDELPSSKITVFQSLRSRPISYSMKLDPTRSI